jgi:prephenate dehydrogenase
MPLPSASGDALNRVIVLAQSLGANPLFIDALEHDSLFAAGNHLPLLASAALVRLASGSASWQDIGSLARTRFDTITSPLGASLDDVAGVMATNRQSLIYWIDQYMLVLQDLRDVVAQGDTENLQEVIANAQVARRQWIKRNAASENDNSLSGRQVEQSDEMRTELEQAIRDTRPGSRMFGRYLGDRIFGKKEGK